MYFTRKQIGVLSPSLVTSTRIDVIGPATSLRKLVPGYFLDPPLTHPRLFLFFRKFWKDSLLMGHNSAKIRQVMRHPQMSVQAANVF